ncbi:MAG: hypothetical protein A3J74_02160 [Elusimicrobia bacterium RIFCSPHIGHO2_02_FULL_57_9]|nr:MAG: hypothetical protein A3J74_02160 [Elusimicrobia bacterium RIFCSPHIGHO2_02_FULL_57_9]
MTSTTSHGNKGAGKVKANQIQPARSRKRTGPLTQRVDYSDGFLGSGRGIRDRLLLATNLAGEICAGA